jgi:hypothetical protein
LRRNSPLLACRQNVPESSAPLEKTAKESRANVAKPVLRDGPADGEKGDYFRIDTSPYKAGQDYKILGYPRFMIVEIFFKGRQFPDWEHPAGPGRFQSGPS